MHQLVESLWAVMEYWVPRTDLPTRLSFANVLNHLVDTYLADDPHPRMLFFIKGKSEMEIANDEIRLRRRAEGSDKSSDNVEAFEAALNAARIAFENAGDTTALSQLTEPASNVEIDELLGDVYYELGEGASSWPLTNGPSTNSSKPMSRRMRSFWRRAFWRGWQVCRSPSTPARTGRRLTPSGMIDGRGSGACIICAHWPRRMGIEPRASRASCLRICANVRWIQVPGRAVSTVSSGGSDFSIAMPLMA